MFYPSDQNQEVRFYNNNDMAIRRRKKSVSVYVFLLAVSVLFLWYQTRDDFSYSDFYQPDMKVHICGNSSESTELASVVHSQRTTVELFIAILSAPVHQKRRNAIRKSWASTVQNYSAVYKFFTDSRSLKPEINRSLISERDLFSDLEFTPTPGGYWMSHRFLYALFWAFKHYKFNFFLRLDDDYFLCLNHMMDDLRYRKGETFLYHGWLKCTPRMVAMDEGFVLFSVDLLHEIVRRNNSLCCHPFGDQMIAMWLYRLEREGYNISYFADNDRLLHSYGDFQAKNNLCSTMLGIHQAYPSQMLHYWNLTSTTWFKTKFEFIPRKKYFRYCPFPRGWDWKLLWKTYRHEPKACWEKGVSWPTLRNFTIHQGRESEN